MLIERAKVTMQSFLWAEKLQQDHSLQSVAKEAAQHGEALMKNEPAVSLEDVFKAKQGQHQTPFTPGLAHQIWHLSESCMTQAVS